MHLETIRSVAENELIYMDRDIYDAITDNSYTFDSYVFLGKPYLVNNPENRVLQIGDVCWVHPTIWTHVPQKYQVMIVENQLFNNMGGKMYRLCSYMPKGHVSELRGYTFYRMEFIQHVDPIHILGINNYKDY